ncbi:signal peptidase I [Candidatus Magnetobacterium casense]|uniref:signal peptidase I n=1 Tax=Candidatus Magnetobacterium casense TaxID=1455061 RepID=UPI000AAD1B55|nr:signal peptidase I [Candidatus Magnetobacterium casensis]
MNQEENQSDNQTVKQTRKSLLREYVESIVTALVLALLIRAFVIQAFKIPSGSMIPTLLVGDHILVKKFTYGVQIPFTDKKILVFNSPQRGEVIVFKFPEDTSRDFIKRVIAKEGDVVEVKKKKLYVNGAPMTEPYAQYVDTTGATNSVPRDNLGPITVPKGNIFVMGDNRDQSYDSRFWGFVDISLVKGEALIIYWSWDSNSNWVRFNRLGRLVK